MTDKQKRLEKVLLEYIERTVKESTPGHPEEIMLVPALAQALVSLWKI